MTTGSEKRRRSRLGVGADRRRDSLTLYEADISGARALLRILRSELDALTFAEQFENGAANGAAMEEVLDPSFVANEPETLVD